MANIEEVGKNIKKKFDDILNSIKKKFKEKPVFYTALIVVVIFALYKLFSSGDEEIYTEDEVVTDAYVPVGYDGYPYMSDSMMEDYESLLSGTTSSTITGGGTTSSGTVNNDSSSYVEDSYIYDETYYRDIISGLQSENESLYEDMELLNTQLYGLEQDALANTIVYDESGDVYDGLGNLIFSETTGYKVLTGSGTAAQTQLALETQSNLTWRNSVLQQMQANSSAFGKATTTAEKDALYSANQKLGKSIGLTFDSSTGKWYEQDGSEALVYSNTSNKTTTTTTQKNTGTSGSKSYGGISYDVNTDYAQKIKDAKASGASQSVIDTLTAQRNAKIAGENLNSDGSKKTTSSSSKSSSSSSKKTTTTSTKTTSSSKGETNRDSGKSSYGGVAYDKNKDYAQAIKDAKKSGASQSTINTLTAQRNAKIKGENLNSDGSKKKTNTGTVNPSK